MSFRELLRQGTPIDRVQNIERRVQFAELCLDQPEKLNSSHVYYALSHLAQIPELDITLEYFDRLQDETFRLNTDAYVLARDKIKEAKELACSIIKEKYATG